jgi:hypothetical protein
MYTFYFALLIVVYVAVVVFLWKTFDWFNMSLLDRATTTGFDYFLKKLFFAVLFPTIGLSMWYNDVYLIKTANSDSGQNQTSTNYESANSTPAIAPDISPTNQQSVNSPPSNTQRNINETETETYTGDDPIVRQRLGLPPKE